MSNCLVCNNNLKHILDLGRQPRANNFLTQDQLRNDEYFYQLELGYCKWCNLTQTINRPSKEVMFNDNYAYYSSVNQPMVKHFKDFSAKLKNQIDKDAFIVEIGSNDGVFLQHFKDYKHLGIEPSSNVANVAKQKGINCVSKFFNTKLCDSVIKKHQKADVIYAANVIGHTENIVEIIEGVKYLLNDDGSFILEIYYLPNLIENNNFDLIYDEHIFYYTLHSLNKLMNRYDLELYDVDMIPVHGGSIRAYISHSHVKPKSIELQYALKKERKLNYHDDTNLSKLSNNVQKTKNDLIELLKKIKSENKIIAGYGATAKSTTIMNYCQVGKYIDYIVDNTPFKQNKYTPGEHVKIIPEEEFKKLNPDYTVLFAWNYADVIIEKQNWYVENNNKWILINPEVKIVG